MVVGENDRAVLEGHEILEKVDTLFVHSHYNPSRYYNDIAVVKLGNPVPAYTEYVRPVCLPSANQSYENMICTVTGWGAAHSGKYENMICTLTGWCAARSGKSTKAMRT